MADIVIKQEKEEEKKGLDETDIKETLKKADEYTKLKEQNDKLEVELARQLELKAKIALGGKSEAGQAPTEKTQEDIDKEESDKILKTFS